MHSEIFETIKDLRPHYFKQAFPKIFSWEELEHLLNLRPFVNSNRLRITDSNEGYTWPMQGYLSDVNSFPPTLLDNEILKKYVCYLGDASRANKQLNKIANEIEKSFPQSVTDAHIYFSLGDQFTEGFGIHMDTVYVLLIHVEGKSRFQMWDQNITEQIGGKRIGVPNLPEPPTIDEVIETGDAVFIPVNTYHKVTSLTKRLSVSFPIVMNSELPPQDRHWIKLNEA